MMVRVRLKAMLLLSVTAIAACSATSGPALPVGSPSGPGVTSGTASVAEWPTYHRDARGSGTAAGTTGTNQVSGLKTDWSRQLDGAVYGQPLAVGSAIYAATENNTVYALDAKTGAVQWRTHLGGPQPLGGLACGNIDPLGITSTMVYDPATRQVFALAETDGGHHTLFGLDASSGAVRLHREAEPPHGEPSAHQQRAALNLLDGRVYIAYGGLFGDCGDYIGSVVAVPTTGTGPLLSYALPTSKRGGIWSSGGGIILNGHLLYAVGNGISTSGYDGTDSVIALTANLQLADRFSPSTWAEDNARDLDLGSMTPAAVGNYVFIAGKRGTGYTLRADHLGGIGGQVAEAHVCTAFGGAAVQGDTVYVPCTDGIRAVAVDGAGAIHVQWHASVAAGGSPTVSRQGVWVVDYDAGVLYVLDPASGRPSAKISIGAAPHFASPTLAGGRAYIGTMKGVVAISGG